MAKTEVDEELEKGERGWLCVSRKRGKGVASRMVARMGFRVVDGGVLVKKGDYIKD